MINIVVLV